MDQHMQALVDAAPPPSPEQIARLRLIFSGVITKGEGADAAA
jgi:hypothetical protein